ncbi:hypothetical protein BD414DRAFT_45648 [Trametes punicea]|nr:hypothetical protein BD414DRAFT_45648 [Trametes punicea]
MSPRRIHRGQPASGQSIVGAMCSPAEPPNLLPNFRPAIWFQYKKARSVALQTTQDRSKWAATFLAEFHEDMRALGLEPPIQPDKVEISWRAAQIRAVYSVRHRSSCDIIKNFVIRMVTLEHFKQMCAERFIARVLYVEGSTVVASDAVAAPSNPHIVLGRVPKPQTCSQAPQDGSNVGIRTMAQVSPFLFNDAVSVTENKAPSSCSTSAKVSCTSFGSPKQLGAALWHATARRG